jgi:hypothetical protein
MPALRTALVTAVALATATPALGGEYTSIGPRVMTARDATLPRDGGVLVGCCEVTSKDDHDADPTIQRAWRFRSGGRSQRPTIETLAPGLSVYRPARRGDLVLVNEDGTELGAFHDGAEASRFAADVPPITGVSVVTSPSEPVDWSVDAAKGPPAGAVAVIVYAVDRGRRTAINWYRLEGGEEPRRRPPGNRLPRVGERVEIRWVDAFGRRSPASKVVVVGSVFSCRYGDPGCPQPPEELDGRAHSGTALQDSAARPSSGPR